MHRRQTGLPSEWLIADGRSLDRLDATIRRLPPGTGVLLLCHDLGKSERTRLRRRVLRAARSRRLVLLDETGFEAARVHDAREIARARLAGKRLLLLSPIAGTRSHPDWRALQPMRAAALVRMALGHPVLALGGMNRKRFAKVRPLGFDGWAGIDAWLHDQD